ncbi:DNA-binding transcriptional regulator, LacI/PurR family [Paenibacillus sp. UNC496MF]|uniref:GntR family transcriptional regulator n=1 Tax=Paenibacillus sp. UNC496MF TaxID=1502753 RepID=UPI0008F37324|nr:GntR family transcriptional regulator [Paenibacillus sp. UNC496MF]SFJ58703.1 DNA-binding transcriptional regulator, LacI/PurR family [Paenibacillus sp. UNC496MF]
MSQLPLYEQIYGYVHDQITSGRLKEGERVPSEMELAERFNVSRITTKKALEGLANDGLITRMRGKGSFVSAMSKPDSQSKQATPKADNPAPVRQTRVIGVLLPDISESYGIRLFRAIEEKASELGCHMLIKLTYDKQEAEEKAIQSLIHAGVDGLIVFPVHGEHYSTELLRAVIDDFPVVLVDRYMRGIPACSVHTDNEKACEELTDYLIDKGHREVALLSTPAENTTTLEDRLKGFSNAFIKRGIGLNPDHFVTNLFSSLPKSFESDNIQVDQQQLRAYMSAHPGTKAFVACEYNLARVLKREIERMGKRVPEDYEIACFDYLSDDFDGPQFPHIRQNEEVMGARAVELLSRLWQGELLPRQTIIDYTLAV